jgi:F-type H+-transporting ATPase subunit b
MAQPASTDLAQHPAASSNFLLPNGTFFAELVIFVIILAIVWKFIVPPVQKVLREREAIVAGQADDSQETRAKLAEAEAEYQGALNDARSQAAQIRENARIEAQRTTDELRTEAQAESARIVAQGGQQLAAQRDAVVGELRGEIGTLAIELSEKIVSQPLAGDARAQATVDQFLANLDRRDSVGSVGSQA